MKRRPRLPAAWAFCYDWVSKMKSPFPGMDPFVEDPAFWEDFHRRLISELADYLLQYLPESYDAHIDERVRLVEADRGAVGSRLPDVSVNWRDEANPRSVPQTSALATLDPVSIPMASLEERRDVWIEILHLPERRLVTAIEVLSPTNKRGEDALDYHNRRLELYTRHVNLVEIDLLRGGDRLALTRPLPPGDYYVFVTRQRKPIVNVYSWGLIDPLPTVPVPLQPPDGDIALGLAEVFESTFSRGQYARRLRYDVSQVPPFAPDQAKWVAERLQERSA